jgi:hypothetical protein
MDFVLRIFFSGLIAFVPGDDGKELNVLLVQTPHAYELADGSMLAHHRPLLLARAASCEGICKTNNAQESIAQFLYARKTPEQALTALNAAILGGGAWQLTGAELSLIGPSVPLDIHTGVRGRDENGALNRVPMTAQEREDFTWVADINEIVPESEGYKSSLAQPGNPGNLVAARLKLRSGKITTYSVIKIDGKARPVHFRKPSGDGPEPPYAQALANWVEATIQVSGNSLEIVDQDFAEPTRQRSMTLHPQNGVIELALLNLPPYQAPDPDAPAPSPQPGQHFQIYYELANVPPAFADRLVPHQAVSPLASDPQTDWSSLHQGTERWSYLLEKLGLDPRGKGPYEVALCPVTRDGR